MRGFASVVLLTFAAGCQREYELSGCDPLDPSRCAFPFPSSYFQEEAETPTGVKLRYWEHSLPKNVDQVQMMPTHLNELDGFSTIGGAVFYFPDLDDSNLVPHTDIASSLAAGSTTVLIDTVTGERVPHFAEVDSTARNADQRVVFVRPVVPLEHGRRYVVGVRGLLHSDGSAVEASPAFAALRDKKKTENGDIEFRRRRFEQEVFPVLEAADVPRDELILAWDYTTVSRERSLGRAEHMRDDMLARIPSDGPEYTLTSIENADCTNPDQTWGKRIYGEMTVPMYTETNRAPTLLTRGADGLPYYNGDTTAEFVVNIPCSVLNNPGPAPILHYGHGLLGSKGETNTGWLNRFAHEHGYVLFGLDWTGMAEDDVGAISFMLVDDPSDFAILPERSQQGFVEWVAADVLFTGKIADDPELQVEGTKLLDTSKLRYYGNSQGGILGGAYMALSPHIERGVLGVGGAPYHLLLTRSKDFDPFFRIFRIKFDDDRDIALIMAVMQQLWDPAEAGGWLNSMNRDVQPGMPNKQVLLQVGVHDSQVTTLGAHIMARAYGAALVDPAVRAPWGIEVKEPGFTGSALVEFAYTDVPEEPFANIPPDGDFDTHECPRREPAGQRQIVDFLEQGVVNHYCDGPGGQCLGASEWCR